MRSGRRFRLAGRREVPGRGEHAGLYRKILIMLTAAVLAVGAGGCGSAAPRPGARPTTSGPSQAAARAAATDAPAPCTTPARWSLRVLTEPQAGIGPIYRLITGARSSVDLTMYELADPTAEADLAADAARGVNVRVILDQHLEKPATPAAYHYLAAHGVHVRWGPADTTYHQKTLTVDDATSVIMTAQPRRRRLPRHPGLRGDRHQPCRRRRHRRHFRRRLRRPRHHPAGRHRPGVVTDQRPSIGPVGHQRGHPHPRRGRRGDGRPGHHQRPGSRRTARRKSPRSP